MEKQSRKPLRHISRVAWEGGPKLVFECLSATQDPPVKVDVPLEYANNFEKLLYYLGDNGYQVDRKDLRNSWDNKQFTIRAEHGRASAMDAE